jgi:hypothetical protein
MPAVSWSAILIEGLVLSSALTLVIVGSLAYNPRLWRQDAPPRARALVPPLAPPERRARNVVALMVFLTIAVVTMWSATRLVARHGPAVSYMTAFSHFAGVFMMFNLIDLVVIDWLVLLVLRPRYLKQFTVPGLSYEESVGSYRYHFLGFLKGFGFVAAMSAIAATAVFVLRRAIA